ncbi:hypothetical protein PMAYCL1PPCAC_25923, partial [Pristionchus mayeri]
LENLTLRAMKAETSLAAAKMALDSWRSRYDELFDRMSEMEKVQRESDEKSITRVPMANDSGEEMSTLKAENEKLAKEMSSLTQDLIKAQKNTPELEKLKKEKEEYGEERLKLLGYLKEAHERIEELESISDETEKRCDKLKNDLEKLTDEWKKLFQTKSVAVRELDIVKGKLEEKERS